MFKTVITHRGADRFKQRAVRVASHSYVKQKGAVKKVP